MKILHTADWHLGKYLEKYSRLDEQALFIDELEDICNSQNIDLIIIAGDIYDTVSPPIGAEKLFFSALKRLSLNGSRPIIIIAGNHDSPQRLFSPTPIMDEFGIFIKTDLYNITPTGNYNNFKVTRSGKGFIEIEINNERAVIVTVPYITEKLLDNIIFTDIEPALQQEQFSTKVKVLLDELAESFLEDTINILVMHLFAINGIETESERKIQSIGGTYAVDPNIFPSKAQYVALGHLHRLQKVSNKNNCLAYYSGSPIEYSQTESNHKKGVIVADIKPNQDVIIKKIDLVNYKPIFLLKCDSYEDAINELSKLDSSINNNAYIFLEIFTDINISSSQLRSLRNATLKDIVSIIVRGQVEYKYILEEDLEEKSILEKFSDFYISKRNLEPSIKLLEQLEDILYDIKK